MNLGGWILHETDVMGDEHIEPINDLRPHTLCWCRPRRDREAPSVIVHNAMDGREAHEEGKDLQ
jgi:hypothetical protein